MHGTQSKTQRYCDFTDGFKYSELSHFCLCTRQEINKRKEDYWVTVFTDKLSLEKEVTLQLCFQGLSSWEQGCTQLGILLCFPSHPRRWWQVTSGNQASLEHSLVYFNRGFIQCTCSQKNVYCLLRIC